MLDCLPVIRPVAAFTFGFERRTPNGTKHNETTEYQTFLNKIVRCTVLLGRNLILLDVMKLELTIVTKI